MDNDKYVVFKREDWRKFAGEVPTSAIQFIPPVLEDAIVIRRQDMFAGPGLFAYANAIQTAIDLRHLQGTSLVLRTKEIQQAQLDRLEELRDFFWEQAMMASHSETKKIPD